MSSSVYRRDKLFPGGMPGYTRGAEGPGRHGTVFPLINMGRSRGAQCPSFFLDGFKQKYNIYKVQCIHLKLCASPFHHTCTMCQNHILKTAQFKLPDCHLRDWSLLQERGGGGGATKWENCGSGTFCPPPPPLPSRQGF